MFGRYEATVHAAERERPGVASEPMIGSSSWTVARRPRTSTLKRRRRPVPTRAVANRSHIEVSPAVPGRRDVVTDRLPIVRFSVAAAQGPATSRASTAGRTMPRTSLTEGLGCTLLTADGRVARGPSIVCDTELFAV